MKKKIFLIAICIVALLIGTLLVGAAAAKASEVKVLVLLYHEINDNPQTAFELSTIDFQDQMNYLRDNGYIPLSMVDFENLMARKNSKMDRTKKYVLITFDDGCKSVNDNALPILTKLNFPATLFIVSGVLDTTGYMTTEQVKQASTKFDIGNHTMNHNWLPGLSYDEQYESFVTANGILENIIGRPVNTIAYPYGDYNADTVIAAKETGLNRGFLCNDGKASSIGNPMLTNRQIIWRGITIREFKILLN